MKNMPVLGRESCSLHSALMAAIFGHNQTFFFCVRAEPQRGGFLHRSVCAEMCIAEPAYEGWYTEGSEVNGWYGFMDNFGYTGRFLSSNLLPLKRDSLPFSLEHVCCVAKR